MEVKKYYIGYQKITQNSLNVCGLVKVIVQRCSSPLSQSQKSCLCTDIFMYLV